jgi:hypothetical protein
MRQLSGLRIVLFIAIATAVVLVFQSPVAAQCSMCKAVLSGSNNARFIRNFNIGVLVLLLPPVTIFCSIFVVLRRHRGESGIEGLDSGLESKTGHKPVEE